jgi:hypothetical protein
VTPDGEMRLIYLGKKDAVWKGFVGTHNTQTPGTGPARAVRAQVVELQGGFGLAKQRNAPKRDKYSAKKNKKMFFSPNVL